jgi:hypothetical protein
VDKSRKRHIAALYRGKSIEWTGFDSRFAEFRGLTRVNPRACPAPSRAPSRALAARFARAGVDVAARSPIRARPFSPL